jgi:ABC-type transport system substrate-binding protein
MYDEVQRILYDEGPWLLPYFKNYPVALQASVQNYLVYPNKWTHLARVWKD